MATEKPSLIKVQAQATHASGTPAVPQQRSTTASDETDNAQSRHTKIPLHRQELVKWNGWGYNDSRFEYDPTAGQFRFTGSRYPAISGQLLPLFLPWSQKTLSIDLSRRVAAVDPETVLRALPTPTLNREVMQRLQTADITVSVDPSDRLFRSHGHTLQEIYDLRHGRFDSIQRIPDLVAWPMSHEQVETIVKLAADEFRNEVAIIPYGGGTSVSLGLSCPPAERRMLISLDMSRMNRILWIDTQNLTACCEAGIIGVDLERRLAERGLCTGHEPDSYEFSSLGGWIATRASGMKKNIYGNIEDLLVHVRCVTPRGTVERRPIVPRLSAGPDIQQFILGSEGTLGVVTQAILKVRPLPRVKRYGSFVFPNFDIGVGFMREIARRRLKPASVRLMDNEQFLFGQALKPGSGRSFFSGVSDALKRFYVTAVRGMSVDEICVATLLFEGGSEEEMTSLEETIMGLATEFHGMNAGEENGRRGYSLTFAIAYIRDLGLEYGVVAESFETSVPWDRCLPLIRNVKDRVRREVAAAGIVKPALISARVTQTYDSGACVYFYFGFNYLDCPAQRDPVGVYERIENAARDEILSSGGSVSHHHGVGKIRARWLQDTISPAAVSTLRAVKDHLDPDNIFASGNLFTTNSHGQSSDTDQDRVGVAGKPFESLSKL